jgi:hypothetical protein
LKHSSARVRWKGLNLGDVAADLDIGDLSACDGNVVVSLVVEALCGADAERLAAIRRLAMGILPRNAAVLA